MTESQNFTPRYSQPSTRSSRIPTKKQITSSPWPHDSKTASTAKNSSPASDR